MVSLWPQELLKLFELCITAHPFNNSRPSVQQLGQSFLNAKPLVESFVLTPIICSFFHSHNSPGTTQVISILYGNDALFLLCHFFPHHSTKIEFFPTPFTTTTLPPYKRQSTPQKIRPAVYSSLSLNTTVLLTESSMLVCIRCCLATLPREYFLGIAATHAETNWNLLPEANHNRLPQLLQSSRHALILASGPSLMPHLTPRLT